MAGSTVEEVSWIEIWIFKGSLLSSSSSSSKGMHRVMVISWDLFGRNPLLWMVLGIVIIKSIVMVDSIGIWLNIYCLEHTTFTAHRFHPAFLSWIILKRLYHFLFSRMDSLTLGMILSKWPCLPPRVFILTWLMIGVVEDLRILTALMWSCTANPSLSHALIGATTDDYLLL